MSNFHYILKLSDNFIDKSAEMAENDPNGVIITIVSVSVVFAALILLYCAYTLIGKIANSKMVQAPQDSPDGLSEFDKKHPTAEEAAAISLALKQHIDEISHDKESYMITIQRDRTHVLTATPAIRQSIAASSAAYNIAPARPAAKGKNVAAPLPGVIIAVKVNAGDAVKAGQTVAVLEAMKMENEIQAEHDGVVHSVNVEKGDSVLEGTIIVTIS